MCYTLSRSLNKDEAECIKYIISSQVGQEIYNRGKYTHTLGIQTRLFK